MACGYDTQTVLAMLFDIDTDNGIKSDIHAATQITTVVVVIVARTNYAITHSLFNLYVRSVKCHPPRAFPGRLPNHTR